MRQDAHRQARDEQGIDHQPNQDEDGADQLFGVRGHRPTHGCKCRRHRRCRKSGPEASPAIWEPHAAGIAQRWAFGCWPSPLIILAMVTIGGLTRLTGSGLSITEWDPIMGAIPPLNDAQWAEAFAKYQQIPQYRAGKPRHEPGGLQGHLLVGMDASLAGPACWAWCSSCRSSGSPGPARSSTAIGRACWCCSCWAGFRASSAGGWWSRAGDARLGQPVPAGDSSGHGAAAAGRHSVDRAGISARRADTRPESRKGQTAFALCRAGLFPDAAGRAGGGPACRADLQHLARHERPVVPGSIRSSPSPGGSISSRIPAWRNSIIASAPISWRASRS